jgi:hypothetical protein
MLIVGNGPVTRKMSRKRIRKSPEPRINKDERRETRRAGEPPHPRRFREGSVRPLARQHQVGEPFKIDGHLTSWSGAKRLEEQTGRTRWNHGLCQRQRAAGNHEQSRLGIVSAPATG